MIVEPKNSQIDDKTYAPLVLVKNGVATSVFTNGLVELSKVKKLIVPAGRYDYLVRVLVFGWQTNVKRYIRTDNYYVERGRTEIELNYEGGLGRIEAELITTEI